MQTTLMQTMDLVQRGAAGDRVALDSLFSRHRARLERMIRGRLDRRLRSRVDVGDVLQEVYLEAARRFERFVQGPKLPFFPWLRTLAMQKMIDLHRKHVRAGARDVRLEVPLHAGCSGEAVGPVAQERSALAPPRLVIDRELGSRLSDATDSLEPSDREVLQLRLFQQVSSADTAVQLGINEAAVRKRYSRALQKLQGLVASLKSA